MGELMIGLYVFVLAALAGREVITKVPPTLHTPLMSGANAISGITVYSANVLEPMKWRIGSPSRDKRDVPSGITPWPWVSRIAVQMLVLPLVQWWHSPHSGEKSVMT